MAAYSKKDIDRVCRASGMSRARAEALLRQYDGHPDRVLEEKCGVERVYIEPERVVSVEKGLCSAWHSVSAFCSVAWERITEAGRRLAASPAVPVLLMAFISAPAALLLGLAALFLKIPF